MARWAGATGRAGRAVAGVGVVAVATAVALAPVPAVPAVAQATPAVVVAPDTTTPSSPVAVVGSGFQPEGAVSIFVDRVVPGDELAVVALQRDGSFSTSITAPAAAGMYEVIACRVPNPSGGCRERASRALTVIAPPPPPAPTTTTMGPSRVTTTTRPGQVIGSPSTTVGPGDLATPGGTTPTDRTTPSSVTTPGVPDATTTSLDSTTTSVVPGAWPGSTRSTDRGTRSRTGAGIEPDRPSVAPGDRVTLEGWGCTPGARVTVALAGPTAAEAPAVEAGADAAGPGGAPVTVDADGTFTARLDVPDLDVGRHRITARCPRRLSTHIDVVLATRVEPAASTLAVLVFFVLLLLGAARRLLGTGVREGS